MLAVTGVMHEADNACSIWSNLVVLSAGLISHNSIHLLIITTDFVALYRFTGHVLFIITSFLVSVESRDQCLLNSKVLACFSGVIMSKRSLFFF